jgi:hypothetical protein
MIIDFSEKDFVMKQKYQPNRGGHAPGHLREAFERAADLNIWEQPQNWINNLDDEAILFFDPNKQAWWESLTPLNRGLWLIGQLWNCTDIMPSTLCNVLDLPQGSSYAMGVRKFKSEMK